MQRLEVSIKSVIAAILYSNWFKGVEANEVNVRSRHRRAPVRGRVIRPINLPEGTYSLTDFRLVAPQGFSLGGLIKLRTREFFHLSDGQRKLTMTYSTKSNKGTLSLTYYGRSEQNAKIKWRNPATQGTFEFDENGESPLTEVGLNVMRFFFRGV